MRVFSIILPTRSKAAAEGQQQAASVLDRLATFFSTAAVRKGGLSIFDQAIVSGTGFATSVAIGRLASKEELGIYYLALSLLFFARSIQEYVVTLPYMIYCNHREGDELASYAGSTLVHHLALSALTVVVLAGLGGLLVLGLGPRDLLPTVWVLLGAAPLLLLREYVREFTFSHFHLTRAIVLDGSIAFLQLGSLLLLGYFGVLTVPAVYLFMGGACLIACAAWFATWPRPFRFDRTRFIPDWRHNWAFGRLALAGQLVGCTTPYLLPWVLTLTHDESATGLLAACTTLAGLANMFMMGLSNYLSPRAAQAWSTDGVSGLRRVLWKTAAVFVVTLGGFWIIVLVAGERLATLIYGGEFAGSGAIISVLAFGMLVNSLSITAGNGLCAMQRPSANFAADVCALVVTVVVLAFLVQPFGALGAALASLLGIAAGTVVRGLILRGLMTAARAEEQ